ncbi:hypothetical protein RI129_011955 [Pyrocoelia pectoralis]|uniref:Pre-C2HC domain-containing protein n=1 Tax=Pyrocoelia pectoralis TaxID=417401 RepID=A0AAN7V2W4_9COLE
MRQQQIYDAVQEIALFSITPFYRREWVKSCKFIYHCSSSKGRSGNENLKVLQSCQDATVLLIARRADYIMHFRRCYNALFLKGIFCTYGLIPYTQNNNFTTETQHYNYLPALQTYPNANIPVPGQTLNQAPSTQQSDISQIIAVDETDDESTHPWQQIKKRKRITPKRPIQQNNENQTSTQNRFSALDNTNTNDATQNSSESSEQTIRKPPPIFIYGVTNYYKMIEELAQVLAREQYSTKALSNNTIKINVNTPDSYRKLITQLKSEKIVYHTYQIKDERAYRVVVRNLHHTIDIEEIKDELLKHGHTVRNITNIRHRISKDPLPMFVVELYTDCCTIRSTVLIFYEIIYLNYQQIKIEPPRKKTAIIQCTRCQAYGHSKGYCTKPYLCVKCGDEHQTAVCTKSKDSPATCALCRGPHPANYKGCRIYQQIQLNRNKTVFPPSTQAIKNMNTPIIEQIGYNSNLNNLTYAQVTSPNFINNQTQNTSTNDISLSQFLSKFETMFRTRTVRC